MKLKILKTITLTFTASIIINLIILLAYLYFRSQIIESDFSRIGSSGAEKYLSPNLSADAQFNRLVDIEPVSAKEFSLVYNVRQVKFYVVLTKPYEENKEKFNLWLTDNNFSSIPQSYFEYINQ